MKTRNLCIILAMIAAATLTACSGEDDPANGDNPAAGTPGTIRFTSTIGSFTAADASADPDDADPGNNTPTAAGNRAQTAARLSAATADPCTSADSKAHPASGLTLQGGIVTSPSTDDASTRADAFTRATIDPDDGHGTFANGDETIIFAGPFDVALTEHPATYHDGMWTTDLAWNDFGPGTKVDFVAFFPKRSKDQIAPAVTSHQLPTDQSDPAEYAAADLLGAYASDQEESDGPVQLRFTHMTHRLVVSLSLSEHPGNLTQADVDAATVVIKNMPFQYLLFLNDMRPIASGPTDDFIPLKSSVAPNTFCALLLPQQEITSGTPWIEVRAADIVATFPVPSTLYLKANKQTTVHLQLSDTEGLDPVKNFPDLKDLIQNASSDPANPTRITLGADIECTFDPSDPNILDVPSGKYVEINGNGYRLTRSESYDYASLFGINEGASLTLTNLTVDSKDNAPSNIPLLRVMNSFAGDNPATLTLGKGFTLTGASLPANASDGEKLSYCPGIRVEGTLIMEEGSQVTGCTTGYPIRLYGSNRKASLRLNGGTFSDNADADVYSESPFNGYPPAITIGRPLPDGFACGLVLRDYLNLNESISYPAIATGTAACTLTAADAQKFTLKRMFYQDGDGQFIESHLPFGLSLNGNGNTIDLQQE